VCFCKGVKGGSTESFRKAIGGFFRRWGVSNKNVKVKDIRAVLGHRDKVSYNSTVIKAKGLIKG
jgi:hypothetical protein